MNRALKALVTTLLISLALLAPGCFGVDVRAPYGPDVMILPPDAPVEVSVRYQRWYALWGIFPLNETDNPRDIVAREKLVEVRVATEDAVDDMASGFFFTFVFPNALGIILPQTVIVQGNRAPDPVGTD